MISALADHARAAPDTRPQLEMLMEYLTLSGLVAVENGMVRQVKQPMQTQPEPGPAAAQAEPTPLPPPPPAAAPPEPAQPPASRQEAGGTGTGDGIRGSFTFDVSMRELATWTPERIAAFMSGLAQVLAAKGGQK